MDEPEVDEPSVICNDSSNEYFRPPKPPRNQSYGYDDEVDEDESKDLAAGAGRDDSEEEDGEVADDYGNEVQQHRSQHAMYEERKEASRMSTAIRVSNHAGSRQKMFNSRDEDGFFEEDN